MRPPEVFTPCRLVASDAIHKHAVSLRVALNTILNGGTGRPHAADQPV
jgi:hypothetical protein